MEANFYETKMKFASSIFNGNSLNDGQKEAFSSVQDGLKYVSSKDIDVNSNRISLSTGLAVPVDELSQYKIAPSGSPLLCIEGGSAGRKIGFTETEVCFVNKLACFSSKQGVSGRFIFYSLLSKPFRHQFNQAMTGMIGGVSISSINNFEIFLPNYELQCAVAAYLDNELERIDSLISEKQSFIDLLKEKRQALISHFVTKGLNPNVKMKDSGVEWIGEIPEHWAVSRLSYLATVNGRVGWKALKADEYVDEGYAFLSTPDIKGKQIDFENTNRITEERYLESPEIMLEVSDVLLAKDGSTLGITAYVEELPRAATVNSSIAVLKTFNNQLFSEYLYWFLLGQYMQNIIQRKKEGMGVPHLFQRDVNKFTILLPDFEEQKKICEKLRSSVDRIDFILDEVRSSIDLLREHRTALISAAVTGKIDVRDMAINNKDAS